MAQLPCGCHFKSIQILKDQVLGNGSYGKVCKALCDELLCAAKLLHPLLVSGKNVQRFQQECQVLSDLKHPNIIQYLGTHVDGPTSCQIILMELMEESLTSFLNRSNPPLFYHIEVNLCHDISLALSYLHSNNIIHRDLSSNNVLLTGERRAKVADFGMSRLADTSAHLTQAPGCPVYMPPEALSHTPKYSSMLDMFSMGVLIIQILTCKFPSPASSKKKVLDQRYSLPIEVPVMETERRKAHIDMVDPNHPLLKHACDCLNYEDKDRPTAQEMCHEILILEKSDRYLKAKCEGGTLEKFSCLLKETKQELSKRDELISKKNEEISRISKALTEVNEDISKQSKTISENNEEISRISKALTKVNEDISKQSKTISENNEEIAKKNQLLQRKDEELAEKEQCLLKAEQDFSRKEKHFCTTEMELRASLEQFKNKLSIKENELENLKNNYRHFVEKLLQTVKEMIAINGKSMFNDQTDTSRKEPTDPLEGQGIEIESSLDESFPQTSSEVQNDPTCQQCHKLFENPRVLPCLHIMCMTCYESLQLLTGSSQGQESSTNGSGSPSSKHPQHVPPLSTACSYDLHNIIAAMSPITVAWKELGSHLGLQPTILDAIQGPPEVCMVEVIKHWIHEAIPKTLSSVLMRMGQTELAEGMMARVETEALGMISDTADQNNAQCKEMERCNEILSIQRSLLGYKDTLLVPGRFFVRKGLLNKESFKTDASHHMFFLFSDIFLCTIPQSPDTFRLIYELQLKDMIIEDMKAAIVSHAFAVKCTNQSFVLGASCEDEKQDWMMTLKGAIDKIKKSTLSFRSESHNPKKLGSMAPIMVNDKSVSMCQLCCEPFTTTFRRHHCRACGKVVCGKCLLTKAYLEYLKREDKICSECWQQLNDIQKVKCMATTQDKYKGVLDVKSLEEDTILATHVFVQEGIKWNKMWLQLKENKVLYKFGGHEDVKALDSMPLLGYSVYSDPALFQIRLVHKSQRRDCCETLKIDNQVDFDHWVEALQKAVQVEDLNTGSSSTQSSLELSAAATM